MQRGVLLVLLALVVVAQPVAAREAGGAGIEGIITRAEDGRFLVEERPGEPSGSAKAFVEVTARTEIVSNAVGVRAGRDDLVVGRRVGVTFSGPVAESYPLQAAAAKVVVLDGELPDTGGASRVHPCFVLAVVPTLLVFGLVWALRRRW